MSTAITPPTPENVAELLTEGDNDLHDGNGWKPGLSATGNVVRISITPYDEDGNVLDDAHFRAVVVPGETVPIVLERPAEPGLCWDEDGGDLILPIESGLRMWPPSSDWFDMTPAEARELAAHLAAMADDWETDQQTGLWPGLDEQPPAEAAQTEQNGGAA